MWSGMGLDKVSTACSCICQLIFHSCLPKCLSSPRLVILCKMNNHRLKNVQGYLSWESSSDCAKWIVGMLLLCFSKEIDLFASWTWRLSAINSDRKDLLFALNKMGFSHTNRSGAGVVCVTKATAYGERDRGTHRSRRKRVWHDLCGCVQLSRV